MFERSFQHPPFTGRSVTVKIFVVSLAAIAVVVLGLLPSSSAHASGGGSGSCWKSSGYSYDATLGTTGDPYLYGYENDAPDLGAKFEACSDYILLVWDKPGYDFYQVRWWRPGLGDELQWNAGSGTQTTFGNAHYGTYYYFKIQGCTSHWYGSSCTSWSPKIYINT